MVQTGTGLRCSHRRSAWNFASATEALRPHPPEPTPTARQTQADASDEATESREAATTSEARIRPICRSPAFMDGPRSKDSAIRRRLVVRGDQSTGKLPEACSGEADEPAEAA
jgi:hypothetical protein